MSNFPLSNNHYPVCRSFMLVVTLYILCMCAYAGPDCDFLHCHYLWLFFFLQPSKVDYESGSETEKEIIQSHKEEQIPLVTEDQEKGESRPCSHSVIADNVHVCVYMYGHTTCALWYYYVVDSIGKEAESDGGDILPEDYEITEKFEMVKQNIYYQPRYMPCYICHMQYVVLHP